MVEKRNGLALMVEEKPKMNNYLTIVELDHELPVALKGHPRLLEEVLKNHQGKMLGVFKNLVMDTRLATQQNSLWNLATKFKITTQTSSPVGTESTPVSGIIFSGGSAEEFARITGNPYTLNYQIGASYANGTWGSLVFTDDSSVIINRVLTPVTKTSGKVFFFEFKSTLS